MLTAATKTKMCLICLWDKQKELLDIAVRKITKRKTLQRTPHHFFQTSGQSGGGLMKFVVPGRRLVLGTLEYQTLDWSCARPADSENLLFSGQAGSQPSALRWCQSFQNTLQGSKLCDGCLCSLRKYQDKAGSGLFSGTQNISLYMQKISEDVARVLGVVWKGNSWFHYVT